jgi:hypothetical protein
MVMNCKLVSAVLLSFVTTAASSQTPASNPSDKDNITVTGMRICKMETPTGSLMPVRVCRTKTQTKDEERATEQALERLKFLTDVRKAQCVHDTKIAC